MTFVRYFLFVLTGGMEGEYTYIYVYIYIYTYEGHLESKERFAIQIYLLIIGKKQNMQVL